MTIECIDGFSSYSTTSGEGSLTSGNKWSFTTQTAWALTTPTIGGKGVAAPGAGTTARMNKDFSAATTTVACGFLFRCNGLASVSVNQHICAFGYRNGVAINQATMNQVRLQLLTTGAIAVAVSVSDATSPVVLQTSAAGVILNATEHFIEVELVVSQTVGVVNVWVDGVQVITVSGADTAALATALVDYMGFVAATTSAVNILIAHYWLRIDAATVLGHKLRVDAVVPNADGSHMDWTTSDGSTDVYAMINELPQSDVDYMQAADVGDYGLFPVSSLPVTPTNIYAINIVGWGEKTDSSNRQVALGVESGGTTSDGPNMTMVNGVSTIMTRIVENDPDTGAAWTAAAIAALQLQPKVTV